MQATSQHLFVLKSKGLYSVRGSERVQVIALVASQGEHNHKKHRSQQFNCVSIFQAELFPLECHAF